MSGQAIQPNEHEKKYTVMLPKHGEIVAFDRRK